MGPNWLAWPSDPHTKELDARQFGLKAAGLSQVPTNWVPHFICVGVDLHARWRAISPRPTELSALLNANELFELRKGLEQLSSFSNLCIVRSSATVEGLQDRGRYRSFQCGLLIDEVLSAIRKTYEFFDSVCASESISLAVFIQTLINPVRLSGHLSNERRIGRKRRTWAYEYVPSDAEESRIVHIKINSGDSETSDIPIACPTSHHIGKALREIATFVTHRRLRVHFEWVWDGKKVWVVQADLDDERPGTDPMSEVHGYATAEVTTDRPKSILVPIRPDDSMASPKGRCAQQFLRAKLPSTAIWVLSNPSIISKIRNGEFPQRLHDDLSSLLFSPIVIRSDCSIVTDDFEVLLPRTDAVHTLDTAERFLADTTKYLSKKGIRDESIVFLIHHFIPAKSSAYCLALPETSRVLIDGIWGLPDGLSFYSHDTFEVDADKAQVLSRQVRFKEEYLAPTLNGQWIPKIAGVPYDWKSSLTDSELFEIAAGSRALSSLLGTPVQVMWFAGIPPDSGHPRCLPWIYKQNDPPRFVERADPRKFYSTRVVVRNEFDLDKLKTPEYQSRKEFTIQLVPDASLLRAPDFLERIGELARSQGAAIELKGSILSHAYYILRRSGVRVTCVDPIKLIYEPKEFRKLVRDLIPVQIQSRGERPFTVQLAGPQLIAVLKAKAVEEALELFHASSGRPTLEEMADLFEVLQAICQHGPYEWKNIQNLAAEKRAERGGFSEGIVLIETQEVPLIEVRKEKELLFPDESDAKSILSPAFHRDPKLVSNQLIIPFVPPPIGSKPQPVKVELSGKEYIVTFSYSEKAIVLEMRPISPRPEDQLGLFEAT